MAEVTHLPGNCGVNDIIQVVEEHGAAIVDNFVTSEWLSEFNAQIQTSIDDYEP